MRQPEPSRSLDRRARNFLYAALLVILTGAFIIVVGLALFAIPLVVPSNPSFDTYDSLRQFLVPAGIVVMVIGVIMAIRALTWKRDNPLAASTGEALADFLDHRYVFLRNINKLSIGYVDAVLIGPPGVLVFRITDKAGIYFNEGSNWMIQKDKGEWHTLRWNPTKEVVADVKKLREFLQTRSLPEVPVYAATVFTKPVPDAQVTQQDAPVPVLHPEDLAYDLDDSYFAKDRIDVLTVNQVVDILSD